MRLEAQEFPRAAAYVRPFSASAHRRFESTPSTRPRIPALQKPRAAWLFVALTVTLPWAEIGLPFQGEDHNVSPQGDDSRGVLRRIAATDDQKRTSSNTCILGE